MDISNVAVNLKRLTVDRGTIASLCQNCGINRQQFNKYLQGVNIPSLGTTLRIATELNVSLDELVRDPAEQGDYSNFSLEALLSKTTHSENSIVTEGSYMEISRFGDSRDQYSLGFVTLKPLSTGGSFYRYSRGKRLDGSVVVQEFYGRFFEGDGKVTLHYANVTTPNTLGTLALRRIDSYGNDLAGLKLAHKFDRGGAVVASPVCLKYLDTPFDEEWLKSKAQKWAYEEIPEEFSAYVNYCESNCTYDNLRLKVGL